MRSRRRAGIFALGFISGCVAAAAAVTIWVLAPAACPAIGYENGSPIEIVMPQGLGGNAEAAACFDMNCDVVDLTPDADGIYAVPQETPFLSGGESLPVSVTGVRVEVRVDGAVVVDNRFGIPTVSTGPSWSRCHGPFSYAPVRVSG